MCNFSPGFSIKCSRSKLLCSSLKLNHHQPNLALLYLTWAYKPRAITYIGLNELCTVWVCMYIALDLRISNCNFKFANWKCQGFHGMVDGPNIAHCWRQQGISGKKNRNFLIFFGTSSGMKCNLDGWKIVPKWMKSKQIILPDYKGVDIL